MLLLSQLANTDNISEGSIYVYFTEARSLNTILTGFSPTNSAITSADSILSALNKTQGQITAISANNYFKNLGNAFGVNAIIGNTDAYPLSIISNNSVYLTLDTVTNKIIFRKNLSIDTNNTYSIGDNTNMFKSIYLSDHIYVGGLSTKFRLLTNNYSLDTVDNYIECDDTAGSFTIQLLDATIYSGLEFSVRKIAGTNTVTIITVASQLIFLDGHNINGVSTYPITSVGGVIKFKSDGTNWILINILSLISDSVYDSSWSGVTTIPPSKNTVYNKIETLPKEITNLITIALLEDNLNWNLNKYIGIPIIGQNIGDWYINADYDYKIGTSYIRRILYSTNTPPLINITSDSTLITSDSTLITSDNI